MRRLNKGYRVQVRHTVPEPSTDWRRYQGHGDSDAPMLPGSYSRVPGWRDITGPMSLRVARRRASDLKKDGHATRILDPQRRPVS